VKTFFDHEKLDVYRFSLSLYEWAESLLDRAKTSIVLNIPEGNGKLTARNRCRFFDNARGSALECSACLDLTRIKTFINAEEAEEGKRQLSRIVSMLVGLIRSNSTDRLYETGAEYRVGDRD